MFSNFAWCFCCFWLLIFRLIFCTSVSDDSWISCFIILVERSFDNIKEYSYSWFEISAKIAIPKFKGSDNSFLSISEQCIPPVIAGMTSDVINSSSWLADLKCQVWSSWCMMVCVWMLLWSKSMQLEVLFLLSSTKPLFRLWVHQSCFEHIHVCI